MGFDLFKDAGHWADGAIKTAGRGLGSLAKDVDHATGKIAKDLSSVPFVGPGLHGLFQLSTSSFRLAVSIATGTRIDKAIMRHLEGEVRAFKEVGPYVQTVVSVLPGVGPGASGAISAGLAIADGRPVDKVMLAAAKGALPGGPLVAAAFDAGQAALEGKRIDQVAIAALPIPPTAKRVLDSGLSVTMALASGQPADKVLLDEGMRQLPSGPIKEAAATALKAARDPHHAAEIVANATIAYAGERLGDVGRRALQTSMALGQAGALQRVQLAQLKVPTNLGKLVAMGTQLSKDPIVSALRSTPAGQQALHGFDLGAGMMRHKLTPFQFTAFREMLPPHQRKGFDMAVSLHKGRVVMVKPRVLLRPGQFAGYFEVQGLRGAAPDQQAPILTILRKNADMASGAKLAVLNIEHANKSFWDALLEFLGFHPKKKAA